MIKNFANAIQDNGAISPKVNNESLLDKYGIDPKQVPVLSCDGYNMDFGEKKLVLEKLLQAHQLATANVMAGNITNRGFATNVCDNNGNWSLGTNFNNTRNDISSICGERTAILQAYNHALIQYSQNLNSNVKFNFKIKYLCMAQSTPLKDIKSSAVPCEDCLSWLNTNRYFNFNTLVFSFEKLEGELVVRASKLSSFLPYKTRISYSHNTEIVKKHTKVDSVGHQIICLIHGLARPFV